MKRTLSKRPHARRGFTLMELLAVVVIIAVLMSLILPALAAVFRNARVAEVKTELSQLDTAITSFRADFNDLTPYSELWLTEDPTSTSWTATAGLSQSKTRLRRLFPQFTFAARVDFNADGDTDDVIQIRGSECLVFFLGGMKSPEGTLTGFSKNPINPFLLTGDNRIGPHYTFDASRLFDAEGNGMFNYRDSLPGQTEQLLFASSNNGQGYSSTLAKWFQGDGKTPWNKSSHQLVSPGDDGVFANPAYTGTLTYTPETDFSGARTPEADNIANFSEGRFGG